MELIKKVISKYPEIAPQALIVHGAGKYDLEGALPPSPMGSPPEKDAHAVKYLPPEFQRRHYFVLRNDSITSFNSRPCGLPPPSVSALTGGKASALPETPLGSFPGWTTPTPSPPAAAGFGVACHVGVISGIPTVGVGPGIKFWSLSHLNVKCRRRPRS